MKRQKANDGGIGNRAVLAVLSVLRPPAPMAERPVAVPARVPVPRGGAPRPVWQQSAGGRHG